MFQLLVPQKKSYLIFYTTLIDSLLLAKEVFNLDSSRAYFDIIVLNVTDLFQVLVSLKLQEANTRFEFVITGVRPVLFQKSSTTLEKNNYSALVVTLFDKFCYVLRRGFLPVGDVDMTCG